MVVVVVVVMVVLGVGCGRAPTRGTTPGRTTGRGLTLTATFELVVLEAGHHDGDVAGALADACASPAGAGAPALLRRTLVGESPGDEQLVLGHMVVVLGVGNRGVEQLADVVGRAALAEPQRVARGCHVLARDELEDRSDLGGRRAQVAQAGRRLAGGHAGGHGLRHCYRLTDRSWPAWYLNVRVGANSPSLCPTIDSPMYTGTCLRPSCTAMV